MIKTIAELKNYLAADAKLYPKLSNGVFRRIKNRIATTPQSSQWKIFSYIRVLRYAEYHLNNSLLSNRISIKSIYHTICLIYDYWRLRRLSYQTGFQISPNSVGKGLMIYHYGSIIVNGEAKIGDNCTLFPGIVVGAKPNGVPKIGNHVMIGAGAKVLGGVTIGDNVTIAPNAVVVKDVPKDAIVVGVPAKILRIKSNEDSTN